MTSEYQCFFGGWCLWILLEKLSCPKVTLSAELGCHVLPQFHLRPTPNEWRLRLPSTLCSVGVRASCPC